LLLFVLYYCYLLLSFFFFFYFFFFFFQDYLSSELRVAENTLRQMNMAARSIK